MKVDGLHHVTAITADIEANLYGRLLGLRLVWQGVNADDPEMRHVAYGDEQRRRDRVAAAQLRLTPVMDRKTNKSVYFREPSRVLFELATDRATTC